jgi:ribonuclease-3
MPTIDTKIAQAEQVLGHVFVNKALCAEAIQMAGPRAMASFNETHQIVYNNKRLAILGDAILTQQLCKMWYRATTVRGMSLPSIYATRHVV